MAQALWTVDSTPMLDVPGMASDGNLTFAYAAGGMRLTNGTLLIADRGENAIRIVDAAGKLLRSAGRTGDGPGEFQSMIWAGRCGEDSLLVWDLRRRVASLIGASGAIARQFAVPAGDTAQMPMQFACSPRGTTGTMVYRGVPRPIRGAVNPRIQNVISVTAAVYRIRADGSIAQRLGDVPAGELVATVSPSGGRGSAPRPLGRSAWVAALEDAVVIGSADSALVMIVRASGETSRHALPIVPRAPTQAEFDEAVQATASVIPASIRQAMAEQLAAVPIPERLPMISALFVDAEGLLWVQTTPPGARNLDFLVLDGGVASGRGSGHRRDSRCSRLAATTCWAATPTPAMRCTWPCTGCTGVDRPFARPRRDSDR
jgi:hypothetical protein